MSRKEESFLKESHLPTDVFGSAFETEGTVQCEDFAISMTADIDVSVEYIEPSIDGLNCGCGEQVELQDYLFTPESDLSWLDLEEESFEVEDYTTIPELEDLWRTSDNNGLWLEANTKDLDSVKYEEGLTKESTQQFDVNTYTEIVCKAMRRSAMGHDLNTILDEVVLSAAENLSHYKQAMEMIVKDHGLVGKVFLRKSAYPNYESGQWTEHIRKHFGNVKYLVVDNTDFNRTYITDGMCTMTRKQAVTSVPWEKAFSHYSKRLVSTGHKLGTGTRRQVLKKAFLRGPEAIKVESNFPVQKDITKDVSSKQALETVQSYSPEDVTSKIQTAKQTRELVQLRQAVHNKVRLLQAGGLLPEEEASSLLKSTDHPEDVLKTATFISTRIKTGTYSGQPNSLESMTALGELRALRQQNDLKRIQEQVEKKARQLEYESTFEYKADQVLQKMASKVQGEINRGVKGSVLQDYIDRVVPTKVKTLVLEKVSGLEEALSNTTTQTATYSDVVYTPHNPTTQVERQVTSKEIESLINKVQSEVNRGITGNLLQEFILSTVPQKLAKQVLFKVSGLSEALEETEVETNTYDNVVYTQHTAKQATRVVNPNDIKVASKWVRQQMSEGVAGDELDSLIQSKFSTQFLTDAQQELTTTRRNHEGASGFLYVDTEAYASPTGVKGCEKAALKHRVNNIPAVTAMDRCSTCVHNNVTADGTPRCALFNKTLLFDTVIPEDIKQQNIKSANMTDFETTASMFSSQNAPLYNPNEFGLQNDVLDNISTDLEVSTEKLSSILFDGWNID